MIFPPKTARVRWVRLVPALFALTTLSRASRADDAPPAEVEVRGAPISPASAPKDPSVAGSTIRREELVWPGQSAAEALRGEVGVSVAETGGLGAPATASVRGATAAETPVYLAGVRINDDVAGAADLSTLPLWLIDRVEIYRGNAPFEADRFGIGGAIFFEPIRPRTPLAGLGVLFGSYGSRAAWTFAATGDDDHGLLVGARLEGAENDYGFVNDQGTRFEPGDDRSARLENADATELDLWVLGHQRVGSGKTELVVNHFEREQGVPRLALVPTQASRQRSERTLVALTGKAPLGSDAAIEARTTLLAATTLVDDPIYELSLGTNRLELLGARVEQHLGARFHLADVATLRVALDAGPERLRRYEGIGSSADAPVLDARRIFARLAVAGDVEILRGLSLRPLGALECHDTNATLGEASPSDGALAPPNESTGCDELEPTGRLAALGSFGDFSAFAGFGRYVRPPTLGELYGMSVVVRGNPRLDSETGTTLDAGVRYTQRLAGEIAPLHAALSAYTRAASELVSFVRTAQGYVVPLNVGEARLNGLEVEAGVGFLRHFSAEAAMTALDARDHTPDLLRQNDVLPFRSRLVLSSGVYATTGATGFFWAEKLALRARHLYQSSRYADLAGLAVIPEQHSLDLDASVATLGSAAVLRARLVNVFDTARWDVVGFPLPGRSFFASLEAKL